MKFLYLLEPDALEQLLGALRSGLARGGTDGWLRGYLHHRGEQLIAYWLCAVHGDTMLIKTPG